MNSKQTVMQLANEVILERINDGVEFGEDEIWEVE